MSTRIKCSMPDCNRMILVATASETGGICRPCLHANPRWVTPAQQDLLDLHECILAFRSNGSIDTDKLIPVVQAFEAGPDFRREALAGWLSMDIKTRGVQNIVSNFFRNSNESVRYYAILCLNGDAPQLLLKEILLKALVDVAAKVRSKAADWICRLEYFGLLPELILALDCESDPDTKNTMAFSVGIMRDGYYLSSDANAHTITFPKSKGKPASGFNSINVTQDDLDKHSVSSLNDRAVETGSIRLSMGYAFDWKPLPSDPDPTTSHNSR